MRRTASQPDHGRSARVVLLAAALSTAALAWLAPASVAQVPGPEIFDKDPTTPLELWDAIDYLVRTGQAPKAVPYLKKFVAAGPDDAALIRLRDRYGYGSAMRLQDDPATAPYAEPVVTKIAEATRRHDTDPERVASFVPLLTRTPAEQNVGVSGLRAAGPAAVPVVLKALEDPSLDGAGRATIVGNLGRLGSPAVPPLIATLDAPDDRLAADAATALGRIGDRRAVPSLLAATVKGGSGPGVRSAAARAVGAISGRPLDARPRAVAGLLAAEARRYQAHQIKFPGETVTLWDWSADANAPAPRTVPRAEAEAELGRRLAEAALAADPNDPAARSVSAGLALNRAIAASGFAAVEASAEVGPDVLADVLRNAVADGDDDLGAVAASQLGRGLTADALTDARPVHPLVEALGARGRRTRYAAAQAIAAVDPARAYPGSSRLVPVLAHFLGARSSPRAVVIDGNLSRGNTLAGQLRTLGYDAFAAGDGAEGFREAAHAADVELVTVDRQMIQGNWKLQDVLANLRSDARTAGVPVYVVGPLAIQYDLPTLPERFPESRLLVNPVNPQLLARQLNIAGQPAPLPAEEKAGYARGAAASLSRIAGQPRSPYASDLLKIEPALQGALRYPGTTSGAAAVLGATPAPDAQRGLAEILTDPAVPVQTRTEAGDGLARSVRKFGPLLTGGQEVKLLQTYNNPAAAPPVRAATASVINALRRVGPPPAADATPTTDAEADAATPSPGAPAATEPTGSDPGP